MDIVDAIKVEISGTGVITPKEEVKECDSACGCRMPSVDSLDEHDNAV